MLHEALTDSIIGCAIEVHKELGPGLLENVYQLALGAELGLHGIRHLSQVRLPVRYKGAEIGEYRMDMLVEGAVVIELKSVERYDPVFEAQLLSYLKLGGYRVGLLINFNSTLVTKGIKRLVL